MREDVATDLAHIARALANPSRIRMLQWLSSQGETCVCDMADIMQISQPSVSKHLAALREAGLVSFRRDGLKYMYQSVEPVSSQVIEILWLAAYGVERSTGLREVRQ